MLAITGPTASIYWGYRPIGTLSGWSVSSTDPSVGTFTATVDRADAFALSQQGLEVRIPRPKGQPWRWPVISLHTEGQTITAVVRISEG